ncbi:MAG TPA: glycine oxidase ThiO, partial [Candidatus Sulfotelmatobacter sp.]|nr:glycine oxidase ThiO [Candidatus Sulfotelmatobacter sp.]
IIGGGIVGCAAGFYLARAGLRPLVLERAQVAAEASSGAAGLLTAQAHSDEADALCELKLAGRALFPALAAELRERTGIDIELRQLGHLVPAVTNEEADRLGDRVAWQQRRGLRAAWLDRRQALEQEAALRRDIVGAGWFPDDGHVNNTAVTQALGAAIVKMGGEVRTETPVLDLLLSGERVTGVRTSAGAAEAATVVVAAGAWSCDFGVAAGIPLPVQAAKGHIVVARLKAPALRHVVYADVYVIPRTSGEHILGSTVEYVGYDKRVTVEGLSVVLGGATALVPDLAEAEMAASWACLRPAAPDGLPLLGPVPGRPGLIVATGHFRNGILLGPITGKLVAEMIRDGKPSIPLDRFRPDREFPVGPPPRRP